MTKAFITSIGESTTDLCKWSLDRLGFDTYLIQDDTSLWNKLNWIFTHTDEDFLRVDADVVCNWNVLELIKQTELLWYQALTFCWFSQDVTHGGIQFVRKPAIKLVRNHLKEAEHEDRPETYLSRIDELHNPRTFGTFEKICGLNGYKQSDVQRVRQTKFRRGQSDNYDWQLAKKIEAL